MDTAQTPLSAGGAGAGGAGAGDLNYVSGRAFHIGPRYQEPRFIGEGMPIRNMLPHHPSAHFPVP